MTRRDWIALLALAAPVGAQSKRSAKSKEPAKVQDVTVTAKFNKGPQDLEVEYRVENHRAETVLIYDRFWDMRKNALDPNWVYAEANGLRLFLRRLMQTKPVGLRIEQPPVPYGRELAAGASVSGKFSIPHTPVVQESGAYYQFSHRGPVVQMPVNQVVFELGWSEKPKDLPAGIQPVEMNGEKLWLLPYYTVEQIQKVAVAAPAEMSLVVSGQR